MAQITKHAALRYVQRVMGLEHIEELTEQQISAAKRRIFDVVVPKKHLIQKIGRCEINIDDHWWVFTDGALVTIKDKTDTPTMRKYRGNRMRSGCKLKKKLHKKSQFDREKNND